LVLVIPKRFARDIFDIGDEDIAAVACMAREVAQKIDRIFKPSGINLVSSNRAGAGQDVFHFHLHVIPRYESDSVHFSWSVQSHLDLANVAHTLREIRE
jgi:histidine triad (HIT) family protein